MLLVMLSGVKNRNRKIIAASVAVLLVMGIFTSGYGQVQTLKPGTPPYIDSLDHRIKVLNTRLPVLKEKRDPSLYYVMKDLEHTLFAKTVEEWIYTEEHDQAKGLVEDRLKKAKLKKDNASIEYYDNYKDRINREIKFLKMRYQALFEKEKYFRKHYEKIVKDGSLKSFKRAERTVQLALNFASENNLPATIEYLNNYLNYTQSIIYSLESPYDLVKLTRDQDEFEDLFLPMLGSDSLEVLEEAQELLDYCYNFASNSKSLVGTDYFDKQRKALNTAIADHIEMADNPDAMVARLTNTIITARRDSLNPKGVYKWGEYIIVINHFTPQSGFMNVRRGEAIIHADKTLVDYIEENDLGRIKDGSKFGYTYLIPYNKSGEDNVFLYDEKRQNWQYMVCYTKIVNTHYTSQLARYLPPLKFRDQLSDEDSKIDKLSSAN
ncbi:MAG: hypothetical protein ACOC3T_05165 [Bacteroidota bacterium]